MPSSNRKKQRAWTHPNVLPRRQIVCECIVETVCYWCDGSALQIVDADDDVDDVQLSALASNAMGKCVRMGRSYSPKFRNDCIGSIHRPSLLYGACECVCCVSPNALTTLDATKPIPFHSSVHSCVGAATSRTCQSRRIAAALHLFRFVT